ncbi:YjbF family lipoprotein [uncultured Aliiroseovarius sp.]|uniref:YjbF family lipoprotein n=1 Tax=uncultured Aliiroseovarius sp. TaxID=1658783 RepID=UPI0026207B07|nr:YjbF family lipoprotein [uncultured Aliiroseovarius sp.]
MVDQFSKPSLRTVLLGLCVAIGLTACGSDDSETELSGAAAKFLKEAGKKISTKASGAGSAKPAPGGGAKAPDPNAIVAKALAATSGPIALVVRIDTNAVLAMNPVGRNAGYVTWGSAAGQGLTFKRGVLSNSRGLGEDLMASRIDAAVAAITSRRAASYQREHYYLGDLGQSTRLVLECSLSRLKSERVAIGDINADAVVLKEQCRKDAISFDNLYWVDGRGRVLKSSQWVSQRIGSLAIQNLRL